MVVIDTSGRKDLCFSMIERRGLYEDKRSVENQGASSNYC
jgi:hypothetical protein